MDTLQDIGRFFLKGREWLQRQHTQGLGGEELGRSRSSLMDSVLARLWKRIPPAQGEGPAPSGVALAATGGYGREELSPSSDIDLLVLHLPGKGKDLGERLQALLHPLWDWGLTVGYTVQTPKESWRAAQKDLDLLLSFLDARWLAGDRGVFLRWEEDFSRTIKAGRQKEIVLQIQQAAEARHKRLGDSVFVREPEVRDGKGGLRDYHCALWAAKVKFPIRSARQFTEHGLLNEKEWGVYSRALGFLWRVRAQLHYLHGRREDRLSFEDQALLARDLGHAGEEDSLRGTEAFLKDYFHHALQLHHLSGNVMEKSLNEALSSPRGKRSKAPAEIAPGFHLYHGRLALSDPEGFDRNPFFLWKAFEIVHRHGVRMSASLQETVAEHLNLVNERFRAAPESPRAFLSYFQQPGHLYRVLEEMHETGFLRRFLPEFDGVHCHVQYDRYHLYPVDVHSLYTVQELELLERKDAPQPFPFFQGLMRELRDPWLLKLAALIHDLGKAEGASHALRGEKLARDIGGRLGLSGERIETLRFLVREHLTLPETAQRRDLSDESLIFRFAQTVGDRERLIMLYLLSFADLRAVGPSAWTAWKDTLLRELFLKTVHLLERGEGLGKEDRERVVGIQREVMELLQGQIPPPLISEYLVHIPPRHYQAQEASSIGRQILMAEKLSESPVALEGEEKPEEGGDEITVVTRDEPGLFAKVCGVLTANLLNILSAQISTWENGIAVDQFRVQSLIEEGLLQPRRWSKLQEDLRRVLEGKAEIGSLVRETVPPLFHRYHPPRLSPKVEIDNGSSDFYTIVDVYTHDRPGLLYRIAQRIFEMGLNLWMARISTKVDQVVDVFYIQDLSGAKVEDEDKLALIEKELLDELGR